MTNLEQIKDKATTAASKIGDNAQDLLNGAKEQLVTRQDHTEGPIARFIENQTARLPSDTFLWAAIGSMAASAFFKMRKNHTTANFVGQWAPTFLILGLYNKLVKVHGSDSQERKSPMSHSQAELH